ncbi:MAG: hypothetical protein IPL83_08545 [Bdellovibrionales bacterium]|nr:hypothetical protein [Bdellovibrionales bacterium]
MRKAIHADHNQMHLFPNTAKVAIRKPATPRISAERLPTNTTTANHPIHRWFNFIAGFSPEFVDNVCRISLADRRPALLLDPFAGCGTAPLEAVTQGIDAVGYEAHPFFERICRAKLSGLGALHRIDEIEDAIVVGLEKPASISLLGETQKIFLEKLFPESVLTLATWGARVPFAALSLVNDPLAFMVLSKTLERSSHSATDGIYKAQLQRSELTRQEKPRL